MLSVVELLQQLLRFDTTNPPGDERACIEYLHGLLEEAGCEPQLLAKEPERPNLVCRLPGGDAPTLVLQGHVDVVTTAGQEWSVPPFEGRVQDGCVWGRGALDMKGGVAMLVHAFLRAAREGVQLPGDLLLVVLADEEHGGDLGARFLVEEHPELFEDVRYALGEFGGFTLPIRGRRFYPIQVAEKQMCWLKATVRGPGGHGSFIHRGGTTARLGKLLSDLDRGRLPVRITPATREFVEGLAAALPRKEATVLRALLKPSFTDTALRLLGELGPRIEPVLRNTVNATTIHGGTKANVVPSEIVVELDGRLVPGAVPEQLIAELHELVGDDIEVEIVRHDPGPQSTDFGLYDTLAGVLRELDPEAIPVPLVQSGVTDARFFSRVGVQTYGFLPLRLPDDFLFMPLVHAADERVPVEALEFGAEAVWRALQRFH